MFKKKIKEEEIIDLVQITKDKEVKYINDSTEPVVKINYKIDLNNYQGPSWRYYSYYVLNLNSKQLIELRDKLNKMIIE